MNIHYTLNNKQPICGDVVINLRNSWKLTTNPKKVNCGRCLRTLRIIEERNEPDDSTEDEKDHLGW